MAYVHELIISFLSAVRELVRRALSVANIQQNLIK